MRTGQFSTLSIHAGKPALDAINVFNPGCYYGFRIDDFKDKLIRESYYTIVRTYGQVPKVDLRTRSSALQLCPL